MKIEFQDSLWWPPNRGILIKGEQRLTRQILLEELKRKAKTLDPQEEEKLRRACQDFESFFFYYLLKQMRQSLGGDRGLFKESRSLQFYWEMFDEAVANKIAESKGTGLSELLYRKIKEGLLSKALFF